MEGVEIAEVDGRDYIYDHVPTLWELMPKTGGLPGVTYAQVCVQHLRAAQDDGWSKLSGGSKTYTIIGPKGEADMELVAKGDPIPGSDVYSGRRMCVVDKTVAKLTGLAPNGKGLAFEPEPAVTASVTPEVAATPEVATAQPVVTGPPKRKRGRPPKNRQVTA